ncbi:MAG: hypothetical protein C0473_01075 [Cyanobacteria bacterium DS3.002]|nr:hypothetical protein [Cyanobacteria bacterium DS3.002]
MDIGKIIILAGYAICFFCTTLFVVLNYQPQNKVGSAIFNLGVLIGFPAFAASSAIICTVFSLIQDCLKKLADAFVCRD